MHPTNQQIAGAFSGGDFEFAYPADDVCWNVGGDQVLNGKAKMTEFCGNPAEYFAADTNDFSLNIMIVDSECVAIDSTAAFIDKDGKTTQISSCDVYSFDDGKLRGFASYCIATNK